MNTGDLWTFIKHIAIKLTFQQTKKRRKHKPKKELSNTHAKICCEGKAMTYSVWEKGNIGGIFSGEYSQGNLTIFEFRKWDFQDCTG